MLLLSISLPAYASETPDQNAETNSSIAADDYKEGIIAALQDIEMVSLEFGLEDVQFSEIMIGHEMHKYEYTNNGFEDDGITYPLFYNEKLGVV